MPILIGRICSNWLRQGGRGPQMEGVCVRTPVRHLTKDPPTSGLPNPPRHPRSVVGRKTHREGQTSERLFPQSSLPPSPRKPSLVYTPPFTSLQKPRASCTACPTVHRVDSPLNTAAPHRRITRLSFPPKLKQPDRHPHLPHSFSVLHPAQLTCFTDNPRAAL